MITILSTFASALPFRLRSRASLELEPHSPSASSERATAPAQRSASAVRDRPGALGVALPDLAAMLGRHGVGQARTVIQWHHEGFRLHWRRRSRPLGRPKKSTQIRDLIRRMSMANPLWGAPRIHGELLKLGIAVCQATVRRYMPWRPKVPSPTWPSFLHNHMREIAAVDMFVVATATFRLLYTLHPHRPRP
jgi:hypothetical protein